MEAGTPGKPCADGEITVKQGTEGDGMYVVQEGEVEILQEHDDRSVRLTILEKGDFFGEVPLFERVDCQLIFAGMLRRIARAAARPSASPPSGVEPSPAP
ncbi:MAG: cyclic nucleotide-binding domain-containing protein [Gemmatimonadota bacterium]